MPDDEHTLAAFRPDCKGVKRPYRRWATDEQRTAARKASERRYVVRKRCLAALLAWNLGRPKRRKQWPFLPEVALDLKRSAWRAYYHSERGREVVRASRERHPWDPEKQRAYLAAYRRSEKATLRRAARASARALERTPKDPRAFYERRAKARAKAKAYRATDKWKAWYAARRQRLAADPSARLKQRDHARASAERKKVRLRACRSVFEWNQGLAKAVAQ